MAEIVERKAFTEGLSDLNENMTTLAELAELAIRKAVATLDFDHPEPEGGKDVVTIDQEMYALREQVVRRCVDLIALHAPVARDLRQVTTSIEISNDLDRIGRYSRDIVEITEILGADVRGPTKAAEHLVEMGQQAIALVNRAVQAFVERRADLVVDIVARDDPVDRLHDEVFREIIARIEDRSITPRIGAEFILINRYFERLADHAVNIGLHVTYYVTGVRPHWSAHTGEPAPPVLPTA